MKERMSKEEYEAVKHEVTERLKDIVYATAELHAEDVLRGIKDEVLSGESDSTITFSFRVSMCYADIKQIVARMRRK